MNERTTDPRAARVVALFEALRLDDVARLGAYYSAQARFKDPFNEVQGVADIQRVFEHMFEALDEPRFVVHEIVVQGDRCFLVWDFQFGFKRFRRGVQTVRGGSLLRFNAQGLIVEHRDFWDAAEELYEKLPFVGALMRWLKKRANA